MIGAQVIYQHIERALTRVEEADQAERIERQRLGEAITAHVERLQRRAEQVQSTPTITQGSPYRALLEYDIDHVAWFYGRSAATTDLLERLQRSALTVLHAESGAGKTSLLKAGIVPRLLAAGHMPLYIRPYQTPGHYAVKRALLPQLEQTPTLAITSLHDFMRRVADLLNGQQVIVLIDQFEELFTVQEARSRMEFIYELAPCLEDDLLPVRWLWALRGEWLTQLGTFRPTIKNPFGNEYLLRALTTEEAHEVIVEPVSRLGMTYEEGLVSQLIADLGEQEITPAQLQLVCSALFDERGQTATITGGLYASLGGVSGILRNHLTRVLKRDVPHDQRQAARQLLEALVTSEKRRTLRTQEDLIAELGLEDIPPEIVEAVLGQLVDSRLLRVDEIGDDQSIIAYELAHDYLLDEIELDPAVQAHKAA